MSSIARIASCDPSNLSDAVEKLVRAGLVSRQESPTDRRNKLLILTDKGIRIRQQIFKAADNQDMPGIHKFTGTEVAEFRRLIVKAFTDD